ncbi:hypothetical protein E2C01_060589 [Portunus trituberculatus]|uniref:Uncharacterized protein n=1 Tax=Portunus trituberculatus TaxID=210409 RepID=A0A5B7H5X0_PORTR|nr:hypothetical protein [Portunus trituberculatus]
MVPLYHGGTINYSDINKEEFTFASHVSHTRMVHLRELMEGEIKDKVEQEAEQEAGQEAGKETGQQENCDAGVKSHGRLFLCVMRRFIPATLTRLTQRIPLQQRPPTDRISSPHPSPYIRLTLGNTSASLTLFLDVASTSLRLYVNCDAWFKTTSLIWV